MPDGKYISIGNIKLEYDAANKALKITNTTTEEVANIYTSGGVSAYGVGTSSSSGGGLNGSVKAYADAIRLTTENLSEVASAYSVAKLYSEIQNVASAVPSISVSVSTGGNALTGATYDASTGVITFAKGTFLTAHQSLDGYVNAIAVSGSGNAVTAVTKSGKTITFTKGATYLTSHQSLAAYLKSADAASTYAVVGHTHKVKINGAEKTINPSTGTIVDLGTYLTSHQSLAAYLKSADAEKTYSKLGHTHAFSEITGKPTTLSGFGITDAYTKSQVDAIAAKYLPLTGGTLTGQLKIVASALNGAYNGLRIGDDCYIGDCNLDNTIGLMGVGNNNAGMVKFGKGGMQFGYNGSNHIASTTAQWTNLNADLLDGWHKTTSYGRER